MKPQKSTGLVFPPWSCRAGWLCDVWGSVGQAGRAEGLTWLCKRELVLLGRSAGLSSTRRGTTKRLGNARPGELRSYSHEEEASFTVLRRGRHSFFLL